jgi:Thiol:disulfide interchange protein DsbD, N-terminal
MKVLNRVVTTFAAVLMCGLSAHAQRPSEIVKWTTTVTKSNSVSATVGLSATLQKDWHVYALSQPAGGPTPLKISIPANGAYELATPVSEIKPTHHFDPNFKMDTAYYLDTANFNVALKKVGTASESTIPVDVRFQACNDRLCLPPYTAHLTATLGGK